MTCVQTTAYQTFGPREKPSPSAAAAAGRFASATCREWLSWQLECLPLEHIVRLVDCFLVEGVKLLFRSGVAIARIAARTQPRGALLCFSLSSIADDLQYSVEYLTVL